MGYKALQGPLNLDGVRGRLLLDGYVKAAECMIKLSIYEDDGSKPQVGAAGGWGG